EDGLAGRGCRDRRRVNPAGGGRLVTQSGADLRAVGVRRHFEKDDPRLAPRLQDSLRTTRRGRSLHGGNGGNVGIERTRGKILAVARPLATGRAPCKILQVEEERRRAT